MTNFFLQHVLFLAFLEFTSQCHHLFHLLFVFLHLINYRLKIYVPNIGQFLFRTSVVLCSERPVIFRSEHLHGFHSGHLSRLVPNIQYFFVPNICTIFIPDIRKNDFLSYIRFRTSGQIIGCPEEQGRKRTNPCQYCQG